MNRYGLSVIAAVLALAPVTASFAQSHHHRRHRTTMETRRHHHRPADKNPARRVGGYVKTGTRKLGGNVQTGMRNIGGALGGHHHH